LDTKLTSSDPGRYHLLPHRMTVTVSRLSKVCGLKMVEPLTVTHGYQGTGKLKSRKGYLHLGRTRSQSARPLASGSQWRRRYSRKLRLTDAVLIAGTVAGSALWLYAVVQEKLSIPASTYGLVAVLIAAVWFGMTVLLRTRDPRLTGIGAGEYRRLTEASAVTFGLAALSQAAFDVPVPKEFFLMTWPAGVAILLTGRWLWRRWLNAQSRSGHYLYKVVVLGQPKDVRYVVSQIGKKSGPAYDVVGVVLEDPTKTLAFASGKDSLPILGTMDSVPEAVQSGGADAVIVAGHLHRGSTYIQELSWELEKASTELIVASALTNVAGPRIRVRPVEGLPLMHVELPTFSGGRHMVKRAMDVLGSLAALIVLTPLLAAIALAVRLDSPGPAFFAQDRVGKDGRTFRMYKFRSMKINAEAELARLRHLNEGNGVLFKLREDPRVTLVGHWIRRFSLDELPQLYNVLRGDMSLVGPRPPLHSEVSQYESHTHRRLFIKPGCTGLWQINGRSDLDWDESVRLDLYYVENWSVLGDLIIMWRTVKIMLNPVGAY
jgi:exopolysaccharide biosynthesis polyprenyl glycosylphosphotransferase